MDDRTKRLRELLASLTPGERRDLLRVVRRGKEISKRVMTELPDELEGLVKDGILPSSHAWWLVMYTIAAKELGVDWMRLVEGT